MAENAGGLETWRLPTRIVRQGGQLLHAQCWAWGQDIRHADGNLLLRYGFERRRPPATVSGCSQYTWQADEGVIRLWGFGVYVGAAEGMYLNRYEFVPRRAVLTDAWAPGRLGRGTRVYDRALLLRFVRWVHLYEAWVEEQMGRAYREAVLLRFAAQTAAPLDLAMEWLRFEEVLNLQPDWVTTRPEEEQAWHDRGDGCGNGEGADVAGAASDGADDSKCGSEAAL